MNRLARIARSATPSAAVQFRKNAYGRSGVESFLRDVLAMANTSIDGPRYIITGAEFDRKGRKHLYPVASDDFSGNPDYVSLVEEHIEPRLQIIYRAVTFEGNRLGVYEIASCPDQPYMMRIDFSEALRRGDAYARMNNSLVKLGRGQLRALFEKQFEESIPAANIEIGFPGAIMHKDLKIETCNLAKLPSAVAGSKLQEMIAAKKQVQASVANTAVARLTHARLFGTDSPYEERSTDQMLEEMKQLELQHRDQDEQFLFNRLQSELQIVIHNHGTEALQNVSLRLVMPRHKAFYVAERLPKVPRNGKFADRTPAEQDDYPKVSLRDAAVQVDVRLEDIQPGAPVNAFTVPLRICADNELRGRRVGVQYRLSAQNLRAAATGRLRLLLQ